MIYTVYMWILTLGFLISFGAIAAIDKYSVAPVRGKTTPKKIFKYYMANVETDGPVYWCRPKSKDKLIELCVRRPKFSVLAGEGYYRMQSETGGKSQTFSALASTLGVQYVKGLSLRSILFIDGYFAYLPAIEANGEKINRSFTESSILNFSSHWQNRIKDTAFSYKLGVSYVQAPVLTLSENVNLLTNVDFSLRPTNLAGPLLGAKWLTRNGKLNFHFNYAPIVLTNGTIAEDLGTGFNLRLYSEWFFHKYWALRTEISNLRFATEDAENVSFTQGFLGIRWVIN